MMAMCSASYYRADPASAYPNPVDLTSAGVAIALS
jgi:hypothetical protein